MVDTVAVGGGWKSKHAKTWAVNAFDEWRACFGHSTELNIEELSEKKDIKGFVQQLHNFVLQITKKDGSLYLPGL